MNNPEAIPTYCTSCGSNDIHFKRKAGKWECIQCEERFDGPAPTTATQQIDAAAANPKTIFFSYGHDRNTELVERFQKDLEKRGHKIWIDVKRIGTWDDWKGSITRGIDASQLTIAFLSEHAIRDPGVCRNEIAIALNRFGTVYPMLMEAGIEADIPISIQDLQWPDLSQWSDIRDGKVPGVDWHRWYQEKLVNLIEKVEGEATVFADETSLLREVLNPSTFESKCIQHIPGFTGREWVFDAYQRWLDQKSRLFWIKSGPGMGKSAISANLADRERSAIVASWFCDAKSPELKNPANALRSIAYQLALRWEDYRVRLLRQLQLTNGATAEAIKDINEVLQKKDTHDLFRFLLSEPLANLIWRQHKLIILIDGLDEGVDSGGENLITELIAQELQALPKWISFVVTSRPEADVTSRLQGFNAFELDTQDPRNQADLHTWYAKNLGQQAELVTLVPSQQDRIKRQLIERSAGMILYLKVVEEGLRERSLDIGSIEQLEQGLPGLYGIYYDRFHRRFGSEYSKEIAPLLRLLHAAGGALPRDLALAALHWDKEKFLACRNRLGSYVIETAAGYEIFHKTLGDWLNDDASGPFYLDRTVGRQAIANVLFADLFQSRLSSVRWSGPTRKWLPDWLPELRQFNEITSLNILGQYLTNWADYKNAEVPLQRSLTIRRSTMQAADPGIAIALNSMAVLLEKVGRYEEAISHGREALAIAKTDVNSSPLSVAITMDNLACTLTKHNQYKEAEYLHREALQINTANLAAGDLQIGFNKNNLARLLRLTGGYAESEQLYRDALTIFKAKLPAEDPAIATLLSNLGSLLSMTGKKPEAEQLLREALEIARTNGPTSHPDLAFKLDNLASLLSAIGRYVEAEPLYREALAIRQAVLQTGHPDVGTTLNNLASLLQSSGRFEEAEQYYRQAMAISKGRQESGNLDYAVGLNNLGSLFEDTGRVDEAETLYRKALAITLAVQPPPILAIASGLNTLAAFLHARHRFEEAEQLYCEALAIREAALPVGHPHIANTRRGLAALRQATGR